MAKHQPPVPPREALPDGEPNRRLAKLKASLCKRWSVTRSRTLYEIAELAASLWALGRPGEAVAVAESVAVAVPAPPPLPRGGVNYNVWCPATYSHALVARLGGPAMEAQCRASRAALLADAGIARDNPEFLADQVAKAREQAAAPPEPRARTWACRVLASATNNMVLYAECAAAGDPLFAAFAAEASALVPRLLEKLGDELQAA